MHLFALLTGVSLFAATVRCSSPYACTDLYRGHLFVSPNKRKSLHRGNEHRDVFVKKSGDLFVSTRNECHLHKPSSCKHPHFTFEMCQGRNEPDDAGCECLLWSKMIDVNMELTLFAVSRNYAGFPSIAAYGNSLVTLYTGRLRLTTSKDPEICVSTTIDEEVNQQKAKLNLMPCSEG